MNMEKLLLVAHHFWNVMEESSLWLILGFVIAGLIHKFLPISFVKKNLANKNSNSILKASILGIPLPLCSCSIIPISKGLHKDGASNGATAAFMISTPEIGIDSFLLTQTLIGTPIAIVRAIAAFCSATLSGLLVDSFSVDKKPHTNTISGCNHCCDSAPLEKSKKDTPWWNFAFYELPKDLSKPLLIGFIISAFFAAYIPSDLIPTHVSNPYLQMLLALISSIPIYVCASSSTPIVAILLGKGLSPGAGLVFLLAGPATNMSTILAARQMFGNMGVWAYTAGIVFVSLTFGLFAQYFLADMEFNLLNQTHNLHHEEQNIINSISAIIILILFLFPLREKLRK